MPINYKKAIEGTAKVIAKASGAGDLVEYAATKKARADATPEQQQYIDTNVTKQQATASAARLAMTLGNLAAGGALGAAYKAGKTARAAQAARTIPNSFKIPGQARPVKVNNWANGVNTPMKTRPVKFRIIDNS